MKTVIVYSSMTGSTEAVAESLATKLDATAVLASDADASTIEGCDLLILGASTWGCGDLEDGMAAFLPTLKDMAATAPVAAVFGLGDQFGYGDTFVDGIADMAETLEAKGIKRIGDWPVDGYSFDASRAQTGDKFSGLVLDEDNESSKTEERLTAWVEQLKLEMGA